MTTETTEETTEGTAPTAEQLQQQLADIAARYEKSEMERKKLAKNNQDLMDQKTAARAEAQRAAEEAAAKSGDMEAFRKSVEEKWSGVLEPLKSEVEQYKGMVQNLTIGARSAQLAAEIFGDNAAIMEHHVKARLTYEVVDGNPTVRVLTKDGKPSAFTVDDLKKEIRNDKMFAPFVVGSKATGGGSPGKGAAGQGAGQQISRAEFEGMNPYDRASFMRKGGSVVN